MVVPLQLPLETTCWLYAAQTGLRFLLRSESSFLIAESLDLVVYATVAPKLSFKRKHL